MPPSVIAGLNAPRVRIASAMVAVWAAAIATPAIAQDSVSQEEVLRRLERLEAHQDKLYEVLQAKDKQIEALQAELERVKQERQPAAAPPPGTPAQAPGEIPVEAGAEPVPQITPSGALEPEAGAMDDAEETESAEAVEDVADVPEYYGVFDPAPGSGFKIVRQKNGELSFSAYTYVRYLNQKGLDHSYTNGFGDKATIDRRDDVELNKVMLYFKGWAIDPRFRYLFYTWTNNTAQGLGAQVVVGGNLTYSFSEALILGAGIAALPTVRSNEGSFPYFLNVDHRTLADEFFRGSYTMGFFAIGKPAYGLQYNVMLGNNLSQLGVDAGQLDNDFTTVSGSLVWMPTTGEFGTRSEFGDYDWHQRVATRLGARFSFSPENRQSQPDSDGFDNSQIRLSNGTIIFAPGAVTPGVQIRDVDYYMTSYDFGVKYHGLSLSGEYYLRWLDDFKADGPLTHSSFFDHGFQVMTSGMVLPKIVQVYAMGSYVFGEYGDPWELAAGLNWYIFKRRGLRLNLEYIYDHESPVGYASIPQQVGGTGSIVNGNLELYF